MAAAIPLVEITHHTDAGCIGCPNGKSCALHAANDTAGGTQYFAGPQVRAFTQQPNVRVTEHRPEAVGVFQNRFNAIAPPHVQAVGEIKLGGKRPFEKPIRVALCQSGQYTAGHGVYHQHLLGVGQEGANRQTAVGQTMRPQHCKRVAMGAGADPRDIFRVQHVAPPCRGGRFGPSPHLSKPA